MKYLAGIIIGITSGLILIAVEKIIKVKIHSFIYGAVVALTYNAGKNLYLNIKNN